nr:MAG TPA: hypothetical protein [Caudoviricetes sp.]
MSKILEFEVYNCLVLEHKQIIIKYFKFLGNE